MFELGEILLIQATDVGVGYLINKNKWKIFGRSWPMNIFLEARPKATPSGFPHASLKHASHWEWLPALKGLTLVQVILPGKYWSGL